MSWREYVDDDGNYVPRSYLEIAKSVRVPERVDSVQTLGSLNHPGGMLVVPVRRKSPAPDPGREAVKRRMQRFKEGRPL
jgi:hypothetical protein